MVGKKTSYSQASCSTLAAIAGKSKWVTQNEWLDIAIEAKNGFLPPQKEQSTVQRMGDLLEPPLVREGASMLGLTNVVTEHNEPFNHLELPLAGSLDGSAVADHLFFNKDSHDWLMLPEDDSIILDGPGVLEVKCTRDMFRPELEDWRGVLQVKALMECCQWDWAAIIVLWQSTDFKVYLYRRNPDFKKWLADTVLDFNRRVQEEDYYPPVTSADSNLVYKKVEKDDIILPSGSDTVIETIIKSKELIKDLEKTIDDAETRLKDLIKDHEYGKTNRYEVKWPMINYKSQKERVIPAKDARSVRAKTLRIKDYGLREEESSLD